MAAALSVVLLLITLLVPLFCEAKPSRLNRLTLDKSCFNKGFCFKKHAMYPQIIVEHLLQRTNMTYAKWNKPIISHRGSGYGNENDCEVERRNDLIYEIVDENDAVRVVIQSEQYFQQIIEVEECLNPGRITERSYHFSQELVDDFDMRCKQTKIDFKFLVLNLDWTDFEAVKSKHGIPVACDCKQF